MIVLLLSWALLASDDIPSYRVETESTVANAVPDAASETSPRAKTVGTIHGIIVDGSHGNVPMEGIEVVLRAGMGDQLIPVAQTKSDFYGRYVFEDVPLVAAMDYVPGADRDGVHYPGQRVRLGEHNRTAHVRIATFTTAAAPSPLVAALHQIEFHIEGRVINVMETIVVANPSQATYVGEANGEQPAETLRLSLPEHADRVTFDSEFHGRRFHINDGRMVTDVPWPPGRRQLQFSYSLPRRAVSRKFHRTLDLPCESVRVRILGERAELATCSLSAAAPIAGGTEFASTGELLPAGTAIDLDFGAAPLPWETVARSMAVLTLLGLALATIVVLRRRTRRAEAAGQSEGSAAALRAPAQKRPAKLAGKQPIAGNDRRGRRRAA
jgi:hypothetical protein